ncbi:Uncharacterised protein [Bordetella pertussis]|nr:Uncharacterised protein [Bordetella pertussis]CFM12367.1 Uncharacterised protein [Bordetella pertussis]CFM24348.1 Uncharacterised protein [Bordetella pertussis]CFM37726.1 Uncharacterised protein [Bordetella pertussis]CFM38385.1 Uncharacterised protein [Bordetella pertussis]
MPGGGGLVGAGQCAVGAFALRDLARHAQGVGAHDRHLGRVAEILAVGIEVGQRGEVAPFPLRLADQRQRQLRFGGQALALVGVLALLRQRLFLLLLLHQLHGRIDVAGLAAAQQQRRGRRQREAETV